ncbi:MULTISPECIES: SGNH/GDSL hydrolase family protein [Saccharothrix]|uniref:SGNH/GDSL hydrolase family protein n=1 Tax=Saccharothrix TaxID=2071 RepID=UPI00093F99B4|nr:SGNH/GDSL hydrolase family protein [Saccharothrix sp. CB00851]OKI21095.1 hypothetical protein A6A25_36830 [Saccharothrix sp. CB00851]
MSARPALATLAGVALVLSGSLSGTSATAAPQEPPPAVISLGDSFISGEAGRWQGNGYGDSNGSAYGTDRSAHSCNADESECTHTPERVYGVSYDNGCNRSDSAEIHHVASVRVGDETYQIAPEDRLNIACSGATTAAVFKSPFKGEPVQLDQLDRYLKGDGVAKRKVRLIVLSIGGNDIRFSAIIKDCVTRFLTYRYCSTDQMRADVKQRIELLKDRLAVTINAIHGTMEGASYQRHEYRVVVQSYPAILPKTGYNRYPETYDDRYFGGGGCPIYDKDADWANDEIIPDLFKTITAAAGTVADVLDLQQAFAGHELCAKGVRQAVKGETLTNPIPARESEWVRWIGVPVVGQGQVQEYMHPNFYGQQRLGWCLNTFANLAQTAFSCGRP